MHPSPHQNPPPPELRPDTAASHAPAEVAEADTPEVAALKQQPRGDLRLQKQLALVAAAGVLAFLMLVYLPTVTRISRLHERIATDADRLKSDIQRGRTLPELERAAAQLARQLEAFEPMPPAPPVNELINDATRLGMQLQLRSLQCIKDEPTTDGPLGVIPLRLSFEGNFENVYTFLRRCEELPQPVRVQDLEIRPKTAAGPQPAAPGDVTVRLTLNVYYRAWPT